MSEFAKPVSEICDDLLLHCDSVCQTTVRDAIRRNSIETLAKNVSALEEFVRGYQFISDPLIDTNDEILNWAFVETPTDLCCAIWLLASGFYKGSASSLRNALDIATASLYFQIRQNVTPGKSVYDNPFFAEWDRGDRQTPNWGEMKPFIGKQPSVIRFKTNTGIDILEEAYDHFKYLCAYTHTSAFAINQEPVTAINMTGTAPAFDERYFLRGCEMTAKTISFIAIMWQVVYPQIVLTSPLGALDSSAYAALFPAPLGPLALSHK